MNRLPLDRRVLILRCLVDGCSLRATSRITGHARNTISKLLLDTGEACQKYQDKTFRNLSCKKLQLDELWSFVKCKEKSLQYGKQGLGSVWTWIAFDAESKLVPSWYIADRHIESCEAFITDLESRLVTRPQISTDGLESYRTCIDKSFGIDVDFGMVVKQYEGSRYTGSVYKTINGDPESITTSLVERMNLNFRNCLRRYTRKSSGFSKSLRYHKAAVALFLMVYNFVSIHSSIQVSPAMEAGLSSHLWRMEEVLTI